MHTRSVDNFPYFCRVCGERVIYASHLEVGEDHSKRRCHKHRLRNPCAIEGCSRSTKAPGGYLDDGSGWLCGEHWRAGVPPRSRLRRQYHRYFRKAKRYGWESLVNGLPLRVRFWHFWNNRLLPIARKRCDGGRLDEEEINRLFGW